MTGHRPRYAQPVRSMVFSREKSPVPRNRSMRRPEPCASKSTYPLPIMRWVPGMYVNIAFMLPPRGSVEVPAAALIFRASGAQVAQVDASGQDSVSPDVVIAPRNGSLVELASGCAAG